jgi:tetratricopeptide (TPR) repeat protein
MKKLLLSLFAAAILVSCSNQHTREGYLPVTTTSDSAAQLYFSTIDTFHYRGVPRAMEMWKQASELDTNFFMAHLYLAMTYLQYNQIENFTKSANNALACNLKYNKAEHIWKEVLEALIEDPKADILKFSEKFVEIYPDVAESHLNLIYPYSLNDLPDKAIESMLKAVELQPDDPWFRCICGYQLFENGRFEEALKQFDAYRSLLPDAPNVYDCYADLYLAIGNYEAAYKNAMKAHELGWGKGKAERARKLLNENQFISLHVFNLANKSDQAELLEMIDDINALVINLGYVDIQYSVSKAKELDDTEFEYSLQSRWPNQEVYDKVHDSQEWKAIVNTIGTRWVEIIKDQNNAKYYRIN